MDLQHIQQRLQPWLTDAAQVKVAKLASAALIIVILYQLAGLVWLFIPEPQLPATAVKQLRTTTATETNKLDIRSLIRLSLFGEVNAKAEVVEKKITEAPVTRLNLKLTGVVPSSNPEVAGAIIAQGGKEETYGIDEKIQGTRAILKEILADRVIIEQLGKLETLMLEDEKYTTSVDREFSSPRSTQPQSRAVRQVSEQVESLRSMAAANPAKLMDYINISPATEDNQLVGYRLRPGKDAKLFREIGLLPGDTAISINGLDLTDTEQAREALNALRTEDSVSMVIKRGDEEISIDLTAEQE